MVLGIVQEVDLLHLWGQHLDSTHFHAFTSFITWIFGRRLSRDLGRQFRRFAGRRFNRVFGWSFMSFIVFRYSFFRNNRRLNNSFCDLIFFLLFFFT